MKRIRSFFGLVVLLSTLGAVDAKGQANFWLKNLDASWHIDAPVFDSTWQLIPADSSYRVELWGSAAVETLQPVRSYYDGNRRFGYFIADGYFGRAGSDLVVADLPRGEMWAWLQVRVWDTSLAPTYEETVQLQMGGYGESPAFYARGNLYVEFSPGPAAPLIGLESFTVRPVIPEPAPAALLALGSAALWSMRRRGRMMIHEF